MPTINSASPIYLIEERPNPSTEFFILPMLAAGNHPIIQCGFTELPAHDDLAHAVVIFIRYIPSAWLKLVESARARPAKLVFFMDDDVLDLSAASGTPWRYRFKLAHLAASRLNWLKKQQAELWVSTPYLQQKYADWPARLVLPSPVPVPAEVCRVFYHGSASHDRDIRWLQPVIAKALAENERLCFEIIGGPAVNRLYGKLPRVTVIHPMRWPSYQTVLAMHPRHIGLNPLMPSPFNHARSHTKFFDITRCGAVGIYSPGNACAEIIRHRQDGLIVDLDQDAWAAAIAELADNAVLRQTLLQNAQAKLLTLAEQARQSNQGLLS